MTEDHLNKLDTENLFDLMMQSTRELIALTHSEHTKEYEDKREEVQLLQRIIVKRRAEFRPGPSL